MPELPRIGALHRDPAWPKEGWRSEPCPIPFWSDRSLRFHFTFEPEGNAFAPDVYEAIAAFLTLSDADRLLATPQVLAYYQLMLDATDIDPLPIEVPEDVWRFVTPTQICVSRRHRRDKDIYVELLCECDWEVEHGLLLVYRKGQQLVRVSDQDGHLTDADALNLPEPGFDV